MGGYPEFLVVYSIQAILKIVGCQRSSYEGMCKWEVVCAGFAVRAAFLKSMNTSRDAS